MKDLIKKGIPCWGGRRGFEHRHFTIANCSFLHEILTGIAGEGLQLEWEISSLTS